MPYEIKDTAFTFPFLEEITIDQFVKLNLYKTDLEKLQLLMGNLDAIKQTKNPQQYMTSFIGLLDGLTLEIQEFLKHLSQQQEGNKLVIMATEINLHMDSVKRTIREKIVLLSLIKSMGNEPFNCYIKYKKLVGYYSYTMVSKRKFGTQKADEYTEEVIGQMPFQDVIRLGDYFLYAERKLWLPKSDIKALDLNLKDFMIMKRFPLYNQN